MLYLTTHTINHVHLELPIVQKAEKKSIVMHHAQDIRIMSAVTTAKEAWYEQQSRKGFDVLHTISHDKLRLTGYYYSAGKPSPITVVLVHGLYDCAAGLAYLANEYHKRGWNVFSFDQRSHGESEGTKRTMGGNESRDLSKWLSVLEARYKPSTVFIHGVSMGATTALLYAQNPLYKGPSLRGIIVDSAYENYFVLFERIVRTLVKSAVLSTILAVTCSFIALIYSGFSFFQINPGKQMHKITLPVLLFHGQMDILVPLGSIRNFLSPSLKPMVETVVVPEAPHIGPYFYAPALYMKKIEGFVKRSLL